MLKKWVYLSAVLACVGLQSLHARNIFLTPVDPANTGVGAFTSDPLSFAVTIAGPAGAKQVIAGPTGKYYVLGSVSTEGVAVLEGTFPNLQTTKRLATIGTPVAFALTGDARRLVVIGSGVQVIDTATDTVLPNSTALNVGTNPISVAVSSDSKRAFVLSRDTGRLYAINLETATAGGDIAIPGQATAVSVGPNSLVYVSAQNAVYEIDPQALTQRGAISLNGLPGPVSFTPDGRVGIAPNLSTVTGKSAFHLDLIRRTNTDIPFTGFALSKIVVADNATAYAFSETTSRVYQISLTTPGSPAQFSVAGAVFEDARDIVVSNELASAKHLFLLTSRGIFQIHRSTSNVVGPNSVPFGGTLSYAGPAATGTPTSLLQINNTQFVAPGGTSLPLIVRALNAEGLPLANVPVQFATTTTSTLSNATATTDQRGYAQTTVTIPSTSATGAQTFTAAAGGQQVTFTINVGTETGGGTGGTGGTPTGGLQILKGQGQITGQGYATTQPLTVIVKDASGNPVKNVPIAWAIAQGSGTLVTVTDLTDANGIATATYLNPLVLPGNPFALGVVSATTGSETVNFYVTTLANQPNGARGQATFVLKRPADRTLNVRSGETNGTIIEIQAFSLQGTPIPNVGIRLASDAVTGPTASCRGDALSDASGTVLCDVVGGPTIGETPINVIVGEDTQYPFTLRVTAGSPSVVRITGGNNQTGNAGQQLPSALVVEVTDAGGNLLPGTDVTWEVVTPGTATLTQTSNRTDQSGRASTLVTLGQQPGLAQVRVRAGTASVTFSLTTNLNATGFDQVTGNNQSAAMGQNFAPLSLRVLDAQGRPVAGASIAFQVVSGSATVPPSATTNASGVATVTAAAGQTPGPVVVRATLGTLTQTFNLTVRTPGPAFTASSFVNGAGFQPGISPGGLAYITAQGIATGIQGSVIPPTTVGPLPTSLAGVEVLFNNVPAPIYAVSNINNQETVIVQVPFETTPGVASVTIRTSGGGSTTVENVAIGAIRPGIFDYVDASNRRYAVALRPDGSYISSTNPARRGDIIKVFAAGLGQTSPAAVTNRAGVRDQNVLGTVISGINNEGVRTVSARAMEGAVGVYIVEMEIPQNATTGDSRPLAIAIAGPDGSLVFAGSAIPIQ